MKITIDALSVAEILKVLLFANQKNKKLTKEQIMFIHYLMKNYTQDTSFLTRCKRLKLFDLCDYDNVLHFLYKSNLLEKHSRKNEPKYSLTEKGNNIAKKLSSVNMGYKDEALKNIFDSSIESEDLRNRTLSLVRL